MELKKYQHLRSFKLTIPYFSAEAGIDWITVSIDGTGETYNKIESHLDLRNY